MTSPTRFRCPACHFPIYNRRVAQCESCGATLPPSLLFDRGQIAFVEAEHARNEQARRDLAASTRHGRSGVGGDIGFDSTDGADGACGDGGGDGGDGGGGGGD